VGNDSQSPEAPRTLGQRFRNWAVSLAILFGLVIAAFVLAEVRPVSDLSAQIDTAQAAHPWLIGIPIALMVAGGAMMLGTPFLPAPRQQAPPTDAALDAAAVPMAYGEERGRLSRSVEMEATTGQVREAWRRRSWRYSRRWRTFFLMMLGSVLLAAGIAGLFILIGPPFVKVLVVGLASYFAVRILWEFATR
jgi:ferric-dicitrate binding protein FerR (iron transport regulator)